MLLDAGCVLCFHSYDVLWYLDNPALNGPPITYQITKVYCGGFIVQVIMLAVA